MLKLKEWAGRGAWLAALTVLLSGCLCPDETAMVYPYTYPLSSPGERFGGLPPAVQTSIRAQAGGSDIYDIRKLAPDSRVVYEVLFVESWRLPPLYVESDGSVLYPDFTVAVGANRDPIGAVSGGAVGGVKVSDLPINVANTLYKKAPTAEVDYINKIIFGDSVYYEVSFKNKNTPKLLILDDGTLLERKAN